MKPGTWQRPRHNPNVGYDRFDEHDIDTAPNWRIKEFDGGFYVRKLLDRQPHEDSGPYDTLKTAIAVAEILIRAEGP